MIKKKQLRDTLSGYAFIGPLVVVMVVVAISLLGGADPEVKDYVIPGTQVTHRAVLIKKIRKTPEKYPRMFAKIKKNPL